MKISSLTLAILLLAIAGCTDFGVPLTLDIVRDDVMEAVFRYQLAMNAMGPAQFFALLVRYDALGHWGYTDLPPSFMSRFADQGQRVRNFSQCTITDHGVFDVRTGERGQLMWIEWLKLIGSDEIEVNTAHFEGGTSAEGYIYTLKLIERNWIVVKVHMIWIA